MLERKILYLLLVPILAGCNTDSNGSVEADGTVVEIVPDNALEFFQPPPPESFSCGGFEENSADGDRLSGIKAHLVYLDDSHPNYSSTNDYIDYGNHIDDVTLYFNQLFVPTRPFDRGFVRQDGSVIMGPNGDTLYEWFALQFKGQIRLGENESEGDYQFAVLSDDGANFRLDDGASMTELINNDGNHPTRMKCATQVVNMKHGQPINFELDYHQGPRYHIALILLWRPFNGDLSDSECDMQGNTRYFNYSSIPATPKPAYEGLIERGWKPLSASNFDLPQDAEPNPCNEPAPVIDNFVLDEVSRNSASLKWRTDIPANSKLVYIKVATGEVLETILNSEYLLDHKTEISGLLPNTLYSVKAVSASSSGLMSESADLVFRTRR